MSSRVDGGYPSSQDNYSRQSNNHIRQQPRAYPRYDPWDFENPWAHGLCNLTENCDETFYGICCFPCFTCHLAWRMNESCWITCCLPSYLAVLRTKMRTTFRIKGSYFTDFCVGECCPLCAALQMAGELRLRKIMKT